MAIPGGKSRKKKNKRVVRLVCGARRLDRTNPLFKQLGILKIVDLVNLRHRLLCLKRITMNYRIFIVRERGEIFLFFLWFPCVGVRLVYWSLRRTATFVICFHWSLLLALSLHFSPPLPFSDLSSRISPILAVIFLIFCNLLASLSRMFSVIYRLSF